MKGNPPMLPPLIHGNLNRSKLIDFSLAHSGLI